MSNSSYRASDAVARFVKLDEQIRQKETEIAVQRDERDKIGERLENLLGRDSRLIVQIYRDYGFQNAEIERARVGRGVTVTIVAPLSASDLDLREHEAKAEEPVDIEGTLAVSRTDADAAMASAAANFEMEDRSC